MRSIEIELVPVQRMHKQALHRGKQHLEQLLGVSVPEGWPTFPEAFALGEEEPTEPTRWPAYFFVCPQKAALVGNGGFVAPPDEQGEVEIGYEVSTEYRNLGYATAAAKAMLALAFSRPEVNAVVAHTLAEKNASTAVLQKLGMSLLGELPNAEVGKVWKWCIQRPFQAIESPTNYIKGNQNES
ncbi:MAG: GNAT family N-acetyltransferase [Caldilineaceae bacterium]